MLMKYSMLGWKVQFERDRDRDYKGFFFFFFGGVPYFSKWYIIPSPCVYVLKILSILNNNKNKKEKRFNLNKTSHEREMAILSLNSSWWCFCSGGSIYDRISRSLYVWRDHIGKWFLVWTILRDPPRSSANGSRKSNLSSYCMEICWDGGRTSKNSWIKSLVIVNSFCRT